MYCTAFKYNAKLFVTRLVVTVVSYVSILLKSGPNAVSVTYVRNWTTKPFLFLNVYEK